MTHPLPQGSEPLAGGTGFGMLRPKRLVANGERTFVEHKGFLEVSLLLPKRGEVMEDLCGIRMGWSQPLLSNGERPLGEWLGLDKLGASIFATFTRTGVSTPARRSSRGEPS